MDAFRRLVFTAVIAGLITGGLVTVAHHFGTVSIIGRAEVYERATDEAGQAALAGSVTAPAAAGAAAHGSHGSAAGHAMPRMDHGSAATAWEPANGIERTLYTMLADMLTAIAFSLVLAAAIDLRGGEVNWRTGLFWGLAGFATFTLAPGLGLPPEVPGTAAAPVPVRQVWWALTAAATGGGLALLFLQRRPLLALAGVTLLIAPHLYGAPQPMEHSSAVPDGLAHEFVVIATVTSLTFWIVLGALTGLLLNRSTRTAVRTAGTGALSLGS